MKDRRHRQNIIRFIQIAFAIGILVWLWEVVGGEQAVTLLAQADPLWLIASFLVLTIQTALSALRWKITAKHLGIQFSTKTALSEYYLAQLVNQALPGGIIGDAGRALRSRNAAGLLSSSQAVVFERISGQVGLFVVMVTAFGMTLVIPGGLDWPYWILPTIAGVTVAVLFLVLSLSVITRRSTGALARGLKSFGAAAKKVFATPSAAFTQVLLSLGTAICNVAGFTFAAWAVGSSLSFLLSLVLVPMILLAMLLPLTVSGWGLREGVAVALFPIAGLAAVEGLAASVAFGLVFLMVSLPGLLFTGSSRSKYLRSDEALEKTK